MLNEVSQTENEKHPMISLICRSQKKNSQFENVSLSLSSIFKRIVCAGKEIEKFKKKHENRLSGKLLLNERSKLQVLSWQFISYIFGCCAKSLQRTSKWKKKMSQCYIRQKLKKETEESQSGNNLGPSCRYRSINPGSCPFPCEENED